MKSIPEYGRSILHALTKLAAAKNTPAKGGTQRAGLPLSFLLENQQARAKQDIGKWRSALNAAEKSESPRRYLLLNIYREIVLDAHLFGQIETRKRKTLSSRFAIFNAADEADQELTWLLKAPWFGELLSHLLDSIFWGHSLIQINGVEPLNQGKGGITSVSLVPREHISPSEGLLLARPTDTKGILYREYPDFNGWIIETPGNTGLGLLNNAAPHALYKRFAQGAWSEYSELFGMPIRKGKTNVRDPEMLRKMEDMMIRMGSAAWAIIDESEELEFIETTRGSGEVYEGLIRLCNAEISKLVHGAVIADQDQGGSRAKEQVAERIQDSTVQSDKEFIENMMNHVVLPVLIQHGYPFENCSFAFEEQKDLKQFWDQTYQALQYYEIDEDFIRDTFGIPVTGKRQLSTPPTNPKENAD